MIASKLVIIILIIGLQSKVALLPHNGNDPGVDRKVPDFFIGEPAHLIPGGRIAPPEPFPLYMAQSDCQVEAVQL